MALQVSQALSEMRALLREVNTAAPSFTDAQGIVTLNMGLTWWHENIERRTRRYTVSSPLPTAPVGGVASTGDWDYGGLALNVAFDHDVSEILEVGLDATSLSGYTHSEIPLERMDWSELRARQAAAGTSITTGNEAQQPTHWAAIKLANMHSWKLALYPQPGYEDAEPGFETYFTIIGVTREQPIPLVNATDLIDAGDSEARSIVLLACILMAPVINRPELAEQMKQMLPERVREKIESTKTHDEVAA